MIFFFMKNLQITTNQNNNSQLNLEVTMILLQLPGTNFLGQPKMLERQFLRDTPVLISTNMIQMFFKCIAKILMGILVPKVLAMIRLSVWYNPLEPTYSLWTRLVVMISITSQEMSLNNPSIKSGNGNKVFWTYRLHDKMQK